MITPADHASLVPHPLRRLLRGPLPPPRRTRLGGRVAWLYTGLTTRAGRALELTVQPTTAGVLAVACVAPATARPAESLCGGAITVGGGPRSHDARARAFGRTRAQAGATAPGTRGHSGEDAREPEPRGVRRRRTARLARRLAGAHLGEADALAPLAATAGAPLVHALRKVGSAYADLATAAARGSRAAFSAAGQDVDAAEARLADAVGSVSRRIAPEPAPPLPSTPPASSARRRCCSCSPSRASPPPSRSSTGGGRGTGARDLAKDPRGTRRLVESRHRSAPRPGWPPRPGRAPIAVPAQRWPSAASAKRPTPMPPSPRPSSEKAEPVNAAAPPGESLTRAAATPRAGAPDRQGKPPTPRARTPARPKPT